MHGCVWEVEHGRNGHWDEQPLEDAHNPGDREVELDLKTVDLAEHHHGVDEHGRVANQHEINIKENSLRAHITKTLDSIGFDDEVIRAFVESNVDELILPFDGCLVSRLDLKASSLATFNDSILRNMKGPDEMGSLSRYNMACGRVVTKILRRFLVNSSWRERDS